MAAIDVVVAYKFIKQLSTPWTEWEAYKLGLIDKKGNKIRKAQTPSEKRAFPVWKVLIRNLKKILDKVPGASSKLTSFAVGLFLLREEFGVEAHVLEKAFMEYIDTQPIVIELDEDAEKINILEKGRYNHIPTNGVLFLREDTQAVDEILGVPVFKLKCKVTGIEYTTIYDDLEKF